MNVRGVYVPDIMYGTAWKEDATESLVLGALTSGFRAIDTANQRKHYFEAAVGRGIARAATAGVARDQLFVQTKFTFRDGQDDRLPYDPRATIAKQLRQSFESSLDHLGTDHLDCLVLHGPSRRDGLGPDDREAWRAMEALAAERRVTLLGVSNVTAAQLEDFVELAAVPLAFVQNRCYASRGWDRDVRAVCAEHGIVYQGFSLLTANRDVVLEPRMRAIAARHDKTPAQVILRFAQQSGMLPLTGTTSAQHMRHDLELDFELAAAEVATIAAI